MRNVWYMEKVSICIPAYENPKALDRLLASIAMQDYTDFAIYITDDSKSDEDRAVVNKWLDSKELDGKIEYEKNAESKGATKNTNYCMSKAKGQYLKIMHHDDSFAIKESLGKLVKLLDESDSDFAFAATNELYYDEDGNEIIDKRVSKKLEALEEAQFNESPFALYLYNFIEGPTTTIVRNKGICLDNDLTWLVDIDYYIRVILNSEKKNYQVSKEHLINMGHLASQLTERCLENQELIFNETKYVFDKYRLGDANGYEGIPNPFVKRNIRYLCMMANSSNKNYKDLSGSGISFLTYMNYKIRYNLKKLIR